MQFRPIDVAKQLNISTSALRHYESWGIIPAPERAPNGYRIYTEEHVAYFACIRAMYPVFSMQLISDVLKKIQKKEVDAALWLVSEAQASLYRDKQVAEKTVEVLEGQEFDNIDVPRKKKWMTIGEVSEETLVPSSAIRHWEKIGLITPSRDPENGYRRFNRFHVRKILIIRTLKTSVYSLDVIKEVIKELDHNNIEQAKKVAKDSIEYLNQLNRAQVRGVNYLYQLCRTLHVLDE